MLPIHLDEEYGGPASGVPIPIDVKECNPTSVLPVHLGDKDISQPLYYLYIYLKNRVIQH